MHPADPRTLSTFVVFVSPLAADSNNVFALQLADLAQSGLRQILKTVDLKMTPAVNEISLDRGPLPNKMARAFNLT